MPPLSQLIGTKSNELQSIRYKTLAWMITGRDDDELHKQIQEMPKGLVLVLLTLKYLVNVSRTIYLFDNVMQKVSQVGQFSVQDADAILNAEVAVRRKLLPLNLIYPNRIVAKHLMLATIYARLTTCLQHTQELCGLTDKENVIFASPHKFVY